VSNSSVYDIREQDIDIAGKTWDHDDVKALHTKRSLIFHAREQYWRSLIERGRTLSDYYDGKILTDDLREYYEEIEDKIVIEPRIMKGPIRALVGQAGNTRRSGQVTTEGGNYNEPAASEEEIEVVNYCLKHVEDETEERYLVRDALHDCCVSCYPNVLYWEEAGPYDEGAVGGKKLTHLPWDACVFGPPTFRTPEGKRVREFGFFDYRSKSDLIDNFPDMDTQIRAHFEDAKRDDFTKSSLGAWENMGSSDDLDTIYNIVDLAAGMLNGPTGLVPVIQDLYPVKTKEYVWINFLDENTPEKVKPPKWSGKKWSQWLKDNPNYEGPFERETIVLYSTAFTLTGLILSHEQHWFQESGRLPLSIWTAAMLNGKPTGPADDMADDTMANCIAEIEHLDEIRKNSGRFIVTKEGALKNIDAIPEEAKKTVGVAIVSQEHQGGLEQAITQLERRPNPAWKNYGEQRKADMTDTTNLNEAMQGQAAPRQSDVAKQTEISQTLIANALYIENFNRCWERHQDLKLAMLPYIFSEYMAFTIRDEEKQEDIPIEVNKPEEYDNETGEAMGVLNDVTSRRYKWKPSVRDDSETAKKQQMHEAMQVLNSASGPLIQADPTGKFFARVLMALPNRLLKDAGKAMAEDVQMTAQQQAEVDQQETLQKAQVEMMKAQAEIIKAEKQGKSVTLTGEHLAQYPNLIGLIQSWGFTAPQQSAPVTA
jgi:hypothetical protein